MRVDGDRSRHIMKLIVHQCEASFILTNCSLSLPVKARIDESELPRGRWLACHDPELATVKVKVFRDIGHFVYTCKT